MNYVCFIFVCTVHKVYTTIVNTWLVGMWPKNLVENLEMRGEKEGALYWYKFRCESMNSSAFVLNSKVLNGNASHSLRDYNRSGTNRMDDV